MNSFVVVFHPMNFVIAFIIFAAIRFFFVSLVHHLSALFALVVLYGLYDSIKVLFQKRPYHQSTFLTNQEDTFKVSNTLKPIKTYPLSVNGPWAKYQSNIENESFGTGFFTQNIKSNIVEQPLRDLLSLVKRDFINSWYGMISNHKGFSGYIEYVLLYASSELIQRVVLVDHAQLILVRITGLVVNHLREIQAAERLVDATTVTRSNMERAKHVANLYQHGKLHPAIGSQETELKYLRKRIKYYVPLLLPKKEMGSQIITTLVKELLVVCLLRPIAYNFSQPDYWNQVFASTADYLLDQQVQTRMLRKPSEYVSDSGDLSRPNPPTFDAFLRQIADCHTISEANDIRTNIIDEIDKKKASIAGLTQDEVVNGIRVSSIQNYINRLQVALKRADKVILRLRKKKGDNEGLTFTNFLEDPTLLPFFDDYLSLTNRNSLLQFYLAVSSFQDQLCLDKGVQSVDDPPDMSIIETWDLESVAVNVCDLYKDFLSSGPSNIANLITPSIIQSIEAYVEQVSKIDFSKEENKTTPEFTWEGVKCILVALQEIVNILRNEDFPMFLRHPVGQKLISKYSSGPLKFLRNRSPEREKERTSLDSDSNRMSGEYPEYDANDLLQPTKKRSMFEILKVKATGSLNARRKSFINNNRPIIVDSEGNSNSPILDTPEGETSVANEMKAILNSDESNFVQKKKRISPFFGDKEGYKIANKIEESAGKIFFENFRKKQSSPEPKSKDGYLAPQKANYHFDNSDNEQDFVNEFINLEIEDNKPAPIEDTLKVPDQSSVLPPMIILPRTYFECGEKIKELEAEFEKVEKAMKEFDKNEFPQKFKEINFQKRGIYHEMQDFKLRKTEIEKNELENVILPGKVSINIGESHVIEQEGKEYAVYPVQVSRVNAEGSSSGWVVIRRYSQFLTLHQDLKSKFPTLMQNYELPGKLIGGIMKRRSTFLEERRKALEKYLMNLLQHHEICKFQVFRRFICHPSIIKMLYSNVTDGSESPTKKNFLKSVFTTVNDDVDTIYQKISNKPALNSPSPLLNNPSNVFTQTEIGQSNFDLLGDNSVAFSSSYSEPIVDLFVELFELRGFRRQAIVIFLQNLFGDTVERKLTEGLSEVLSEERMANTVNFVINTYWPKGIFTIPQSRTEEQKIKSKFEASNKLSQVFPEIIGNLVGRSNARRGASRIASAFQYEKLNQHLIYKILDEILIAVFKV